LPLGKGRHGDPDQKTQDDYSDPNLFDPIFQGLAISLMAGEVASLLLSRMTVPILYYLSERGKYRKEAEQRREAGDE